MPFNENIEEVTKFIAKALPFGGGDAPEDICGAFEEALKMKW